MASIYDEQILSEQDKERIRKLGELWQQSKDAAAKNEYHEAAESIRKGYGYSGGDDGYQYNPIEEPVVSSSLAAADYVNALRAAEDIRAKNYEQMAANAEADGNERLRQAYIKNMQQSLGLAQTLKAEGLTGGVNESTRAGLANSYLALRDGIMKDVDETKSDILAEKEKSRADSEAEIANAQYLAAKDRADKMTASEQKNYDRAQDAYQKEYQEAKDEYEKQWQQKLFEYQQALDTYDREYQAENDALNRQNELNKIYASKSYSSSNDDSDETEQLKKAGRDLLSHGVYDDSFPALLGYSAEILREYMENKMSGF